MSELSSALTLQATGRVFPDQSQRRRPTFTVEGAIRPIPLEYAYEYTLVATIQATARITVQQQVRMEDGSRSTIEQGLRRHIVELVFGEFRRPLLDIEDALRNHDIQNAETLVQDLRRQMFCTE